MNLQLLLPFHSRLGRKIGHLFKSLEKLWTAIGVPAVIEGIHSNKDVARSQHLCPRQRKRQKDRIPSRNVGDWNSLLHLIAAAPLWNRDIIRKRGPAKHPQIDRCNAVIRNSGSLRHLPGGLQFPTVPLPIRKGECAHLEPYTLGDRQDCGGVETSTQEHDRLLRLHKNPPYQC